MLSSLLVPFVIEADATYVALPRCISLAKCPTEHHCFAAFTVYSAKLTAIGMIFILVHFCN